MLKELHIQNFAIITDLTIQFVNGLVILTGETGAGKSIILDALGAVLGGRKNGFECCSSGGEDKAYVEALLSLMMRHSDNFNPFSKKKDCWRTAHSSIFLVRFVPKGVRSRG